MRVLSQIQDGDEKVIAYFSRKFSKQEKNYCVTRRELLAVVASLKQYRPYLYGRKVIVRTDHASLRWLLNFKNPEGQMARWLEEIAEYNTEIQHRPGNKHANADGLSRQRCKQCGREEMAENTRDAGNLESPSREGEKMVRGIAAKPSLSWSHVRAAQLEDDTLQWLVKAKEDGKSRPKWSEISHMSSSAKTYWSQWDQLVIHKGVLCRRWEADDGKSLQWQVILPLKLQNDAFAELHAGPFF